jgi:Na+-translocating ferredoxin:NAD+ oxidoreductase subunit D
MKFTYHVSPNYRQALSTQRIMLELSIGVLAVLLVNVGYYWMNVGTDYAIHALAMIGVALVVSILVEVLWAFGAKKAPLKQLMTSFPWVTALILVGMMGVNKPLYVVAIGTLVAILVGKLVFGGFGQNIFNPAGVGYAFIGLAFGGFIVSAFPDVVTGATPNTLIEKLGWVLPGEAAAAYLDGFKGLTGLFTGQYIGGLGETNTLVIALVGIYLGFRKILDWRVPVFYIGSLFVFATLIMAIEGMGWWYPFFFVATGGAMYGAVFMLTDPVTSPTSIPGRMIFAIGAALLTTLLRVKGNLPEGVLWSILMMNMLTPLIDTTLDGWPLKQVKKYILTVGSVAVAALAGIALTTTAIAYIPPVVPQEDKPTLGDPILFSAVTLAGKTTLLSSEIDGDVTTFVVSADGYAVLEDEHSTEPQPNEFEIKINTATQTIVSVKFTAFRDSRIKKAFIDHPDFLDQFKGLSIIDPNASVDVSVGTTFTTESVIRAVVAAIDAALVE